MTVQKFFFRSSIFATTLSFLTSVLVAATFAPVTVLSPDGKLTAKVFVDQESQLVYEVAYQGQPLVLPSRLQLNFVNDLTLGSDCQITGTKTRELKEHFHQFPGKRSEVDSYCHELTVSLEEQGTKKRTWQVIVRAFDDGVAFRYHIPAQADWPVAKLTKEDTWFTFPADSQATFLPLPGFITSHENDYQTTNTSEIPDDQLFGIPLLVEVPGVGATAIAEADLTDYAGMFLEKVENEPALVTVLSPRIDQPGVAVESKLPLETPWRALFFAKEASTLIESDLPLKLNKPSVITDRSWIQPGKTTFPWWNGFYEENVPFESNLNTEFQKYYIDFCAEYGIPYHSLDGENHMAWYGGPIGYQGADPTKATEGIDLEEVLAYAKKKGVRIRVWMHWLAAQAHMKRAFPLYHKWGIEGVMIDFMDRNDQQMVQFQHELLQLAADNQLSVNFHGVAAPTGLERTYPNLLNSEAVKSLEYNKWADSKILPAHDVTVPFTRMLAGPMDYHQGSLRTVSLEKFRSQDAAPVVIGTPCRTLATYVVFQNHLPMMGDYPSAYRAHPLTKAIVDVPTTWDETRVLAGEVGKSIVIARRAGNDWWIGAMTNEEPRELTVALDFLGLHKNFQATIYQDDMSAEHGCKQGNRNNVSAGEQITLSLMKSGGAVIHLSH